MQVSRSDITATDPRMPDERPRIVLNMIVKNEAHVILRCIGSVLPLIDAWCIVDTGSTDGTQDIIRGALGHLPGQLHERPWVNFGHNRTEALNFARELGEFVLIMDADDTLTYDEGYTWPELTADMYLLQVHHADLRYDRAHLARTSKPFKYVGALHEYLGCDEPHVHGGRLTGIQYNFLGGGARSGNPEKYLRDAEVLEAEMNREPLNARTVFYLAQSYRDAGKPEKALKIYRQRACMPGWDEETFVAKLEAAQLVEFLKEKPEQIINSYLRAWEFRPTRAEPLHRLARYLRLTERYLLAFHFASIGKDIPLSSDLLFVDSTVYEWSLLDEYAISAFWSGHKELAREANVQLLGRVPESERARIATNLQFCEAT